MSSIYTQFRTHRCNAITDGMCQEEPRAPQQSIFLFNHFIGPGEKCWRHRATERLGRSEVDYELKLCGLNDPQIGCFLTFEDATHIKTRQCATKHFERQ